MTDKLVKFSRLPEGEFFQFTRGDIGIKIDNNLALYLTNVSEKMLEEDAAKDVGWVGRPVIDFVDSNTHVHRLGVGPVNWSWLNTECSRYLKCYVGEDYEA